ncbi:MAG: tetratricopeptide repeat protein [Ignavibacteriae bacterium]|nr:tetratricopeptide repeat protein [Ignavibacteriota bacterium]
MSENTSHATQIAELEARLAANPKSPSFARLAWYYLEDGKVEQAYQLCVEGVSGHPRYATGRLVLGKCFESMGRNVEAMLEYRRALRVVPDNPTVQALLKKTEQIEEEAFKAFVEERSSKLKEQKDRLTLDQYLAQHPAESETTIEFLLQRLKNVKKITPPPQNVKPIMVEEEKGTDGSPNIVTVTLAEIYARQSRFSEAIEAYRKLMDQQPHESERYHERIEVLEELLRKKISEQSGGENEKAS